MRYKGVLIDMDDTLYDYKSAHKTALGAAVAAASGRSGLEPARLMDCYLRAREDVHAGLAGTASSHNRLLYFQGMFERAGVNPMEHALEVYDAYWETFLAAATLYPDAEEFFERIKGRAVCLVTDLTAHIQHRKARRFGLHRHALHIVTSEEAGRDKPDPRIFNLALGKLGLRADEACMVGDDYDKDVAGASGVGLDAFWLDRGGAGGRLGPKTVAVGSLLDMAVYL